MFLYQGQADAAEPSSWGMGGRLARNEWDRLLARDANRVPLLQQWIGEALSWWHEDTAPDVRYAGRPSPSVSTPVIDSLSVVECQADAEGVGIRGVQAKATLDVARGQCLRAFQQFGQLQDGRHGAAWNDALLRLRGELQVAGAPRDLARFEASTGRRHVGVFVVHAKPSANDPGADFQDHVEAEPHGRLLSLYEEGRFGELVIRVAEQIRERLDDNAV